MPVAYRSTNICIEQQPPPTPLTNTHRGLIMYKLCYVNKGLIKKTGIVLGQLGQFIQVDLHRIFYLGIIF